MEALLMRQWFRQLFSCPHRAPPRRNLGVRNFWGGTNSGKPAKPLLQMNTTWLPRPSSCQEDKKMEYLKYPTVDAAMLRSWKHPPKRVKMLMRDFIEDSLYNPNYGYFPKQAVIFSPGSPFDFKSMRDERAFDEELLARYNSFEDGLDAKENPGKVNDRRQMWHTPTELFSPHYGRALARYMVANYKLALYPYYDLLIYETGGGNGTLMRDVLDHIRDTDPEVYARTRYKMIEIAAPLAQRQAQTSAHGGHGQAWFRPMDSPRTAADPGSHADHVEVLHGSIFDWDRRVPSPCFVLALEVFDNLAHDCVRYDRRTGEALQCWVVVDAKGEFYEHYEPGLDPIAVRFLQTRNVCVAADGDGYPAPRMREPFWDRRFPRMFLPTEPAWSDWLSEPEYLPTRLMQFFDVLRNYFPEHRLLASDFHKFNTDVSGVNAPAVQTRFQRKMVTTTTPLVMQGQFDIMFPTDFAVMKDVYQGISGKLAKTFPQRKFLNSWANVGDTVTKSGDNPLLEWYQNASVMITI